MATSILARQFCSTRIFPAHFRSLCVLQRSLQFNPIFAIAARAASTAAAKKKKPTSKTTTSKSAQKSKTTTKKPAPKSKTTATKKKTTTKATSKKTATRKPAKKKPVVKKPAKKAAAKKAAPKKKKKAELTLEQKQNKLLRELRERALHPPTKGHNSGFLAWLKDQPELKVGVEAGEKWKALPQETKDLYGEKARKVSPARDKAFEEWLASKPVSEIYKANLARRHLRRLGVKHNITLFTDSRIPKRPVQPFFIYATEQYRSGRQFEKDENGKSSIVNNNRTLRREFSELSSAEKKKYEDKAAEDRKRYFAAMEHVR